MRVSAAQIEHVAGALVARLAKGRAIEWKVPENTVKSRFVTVLTRNFEEEAAIDREAAAEAEKLVRQGAPGVRRDDLDLRKVEQLVKQRIAKAKGFSL